MNDFLERVKEMQVSKNLTQIDLAEKSGISLYTIRGWFSKDLKPDVFSAVKIAQALGTSVEYLATGKDTHTKETAQAIDELKRLKHTLLKALSESSDYTSS